MILSYFHDHFKNNDCIFTIVVFTLSLLGVEFAAELRDFVRHDLKRFYPEELIKKSTITLVDGLDKVLNSYSEEVYGKCIHYY